MCYRREHKFFVWKNHDLGDLDKTAAFEKSLITVKEIYLTDFVGKLMRNCHAKKTFNRTN